MEKVTIPGRKTVYRLFGVDGNALVDLMQRPEEAAPVPHQRVLVRHPFQVIKLLAVGLICQHIPCFCLTGVEAGVRVSSKS